MVVVVAVMEIPAAMVVTYFLHGMARFYPVGQTTNAPCSRVSLPFERSRALNAYHDLETVQRTSMGWPMAEILKTPATPVM